MTPNRRLKQERELRGWSQAKVAEQIGTDATTVSRWERGLFSPTPYFRERLCTLFSKNAEELGLLENGDQSPERAPRVLSPRPPTSLAFQQETEQRHLVRPRATSTIAPLVAPSWPRRGDTFAYILDSAAYDQQAHILWEDAYVRAIRGQLAEAQQLGEASLNAFETVGHSNADALREWLQKNELTPSSPPPTNIPSAPLPLLPKQPKRTIKQLFYWRNLILLFTLIAITTLGIASFLFNQSALPSVQAGIQTSPVANRQAPAQIAQQHTGTIAVTVTTVADTPTSVPTARPTAPATNVPVIRITATPANLTPADCPLESIGYRCTITLLLFSSNRGNLSWHAVSTNLAVSFSPGAGDGTSGTSIQVIAYIHSSPGQTDKLIFTLVSSSSTTTTRVLWQG
jgi:transcriptional regulator with XRE-family HTH domain